VGVDFLVDQIPDLKIPDLGFMYLDSEFMLLEGQALISASDRL
jgi:hypothetical protein